MDSIERFQKLLAVKATVAFLANLNARDKLHRLAQYSSKTLLHYNGKNESLEKLAALATSTRKFSRIGKSLEFFSNPVQGEDEIVKGTQYLRNWGYAIWLLYDNAQLFANMGFIAGDVKEWNKKGMKGWALALIASIVSSIYKLRWNLIRWNNECKLIKSDDQSAAIKSKLSTERRSIYWQAASDILDLSIPLSNLGYEINPGYVGLAGTITSIMGIVTVWQGVIKNVK